MSSIDGLVVERANDHRLDIVIGDRAWRSGPRIIRQAIKLEPRAPVDHRCLIATAPGSRLVAAGGSAVGT